MNDWFAHCQTLEEAKEEYHRLCFEHHPDRGGSTTVMQAINMAYAQFTRAWKSPSSPTTASFRRKRSSQVWTQPAPPPKRPAPTKEPLTREYLRSLWNRQEWSVARNGHICRNIRGHTVMLFQHPSHRYKDAWFVMLDDTLSPYMFYSRAEAEQEAFNLLYEKVKYTDL